MLFKPKFTRTQKIIQQICCEQMYKSMKEREKTNELDETEKIVLAELLDILNKFNKIIK